MPTSSSAPQRLSLGGKEASQLRSSITNRATLSVVTGRSSRKGKSVVVMPISIKNEPTQIKHHFPKDSNSGEPATKRYRNEKEQKKILSRHQNTQKERVKEPHKSLRSELDGPGVIVVKNWKPNDDDEHPGLSQSRSNNASQYKSSNDDIPRIRLPNPRQRSNQEIPIAVVSQPVTHDQVPSYQSIENEVQNQHIYTLQPADHSPQIDQMRDQTATPSPHVHYHLTNQQPVQTIRMQPALQPPPPPPPPQPTEQSKIYWVPCSKIDTPEGPKYEQLRNVDVLVSQNGSQELRPINQQQQPQQQHVVQQTQQREARATPFYIEKLQYAPMPSEHVSIILKNCYLTSKLSRFYTYLQVGIIS